MNVEQEVAARRLRKYRPMLLKSVAAWVVVAFGAIALATSVSGGGHTGAAAVQYAIGGVMLSAMFVVPGVYWLVRNKQDRDRVAVAIRTDQTNRELAAVLRADEQALLGPVGELPLLPQRRWGLVIGVVVVLLFAGAMMLPGS